jgi:hypothetical protein
MSNSAEQDEVIKKWNASPSDQSRYTESLHLGRKFFWAGVSGGCAAGIGIFLMLQHKVPMGYAAVLAALINGIFSVIVAVMRSKRD